LSANPHDAAVGDQLPEFQRSPGLDHWNRYAAVNYEFVPIHMDDEAGRKAGYASAFGMGNLQFAYLHNLLRQWMGDEGEILDVSCQFRSANIKGQVLTCHGTVTDVRDDGALRVLTIELWTEEQNGARLAIGQARVALGGESDQA
jgi:acyl dehydratase